MITKHICPGCLSNDTSKAGFLYIKHLRKSIPKRRCKRCHHVFYLYGNMRNCELKTTKERAAITREGGP